MPETDPRAATVREFNRYYTRRIGALGGHLGSDFSITEARVLYELAHRENPAASEIADDLDLDRGYLSRLLRSFKKRGLISTSVSKDDRRVTHLRLTAAGKRAFAPLDKRADADVTEMLDKLSPTQQQRVVGAMSDIRSLLAPDEKAATSKYTIRSHQPGDMGWITYRHGVLYWKEYGWDERFEAIVARVVADFIDNYDAEREHCWVAERNGEIVGSVFVVSKSKTVAKLRLLLVEPSARGLGIGSRLVDEVIGFARKVGYKRIELWTHPELVSARKIYKAAGFELIAEETHQLFGKPLRAETWAMQLDSIEEHPAKRAR
jgi:DNA-binding MarR family transcriptional regulator/GNAT superfamily N-acetyltransferase